MLKELIDKGYYSIHDGFDNWEDAVRASVQPLIDAGAVKPAYADSIVNSVKKFGPYIAIAPDIAIPHAEDKDNVNETTICFMKSNTKVVLEEEDPDKHCRLFFVLASNDEEKHLENLCRLVAMFEDLEYMEALGNANTIEEIKALAEARAARAEEELAEESAQEEAQILAAAAAEDAQ